MERSAVGTFIHPTYLDSIDRETVARSMDALVQSDQRDLLWQLFPAWIRHQIDKILEEFSAADDIVTFGHRDPTVAHDQLLEMKRWREGARTQ